MSGTNAPTPRHPGQVWLQVYASGGNLPISEFDFPEGATDQYYAAEPGINEAPNPATYAPGLNGELDREALRHGRDWTQDEVREALEDAASEFDRALQIIRDWGYDPDKILFGTHRLQSLLDDSAGGTVTPGEPLDTDPWGFVVAFPEIPAADKNDNGKHSKRRRARYLEGLTGLLEAPQGALALMEQEAVLDGYCIDLHMPSHNGSTRRLNAANCKAAGESAVIHGNLDKALRDKLAP